MFKQLAIGCGLALILTVGARAAETAQTPAQQVSASLMFGVYYPAGQWVPVAVDLQNSSPAPVAGTFNLPLSDEAGGVQFRLPVIVPAQARLRTQILAYFPPLAGKQTQVGTATWNNDQGARLARVDISGMSMADAQEAGGYLLAISGDTSDPLWLDADDPTDLAEMIEAQLERKIMPASMHYSRLPRQASALGACRIILITSADPDALDEAQRQALLGHVRSGGTLVIACPQHDPALTWLAPYVPAQLVGRRELNQIQAAPGSAIQGTLKLKKVSPAVEAISGEGQVLLADSGYVHAAWRKLGLGRVVFLSVPASMLQEKDPQAGALLRAALQDDPGVPSWNQSLLRQQQGELLSQLLGRPAPPWHIAAGIAIGYVVAVLLLHAVRRGVKRPAAFAASMLIAALVGVALTAATAMRRRDMPLMGARLQVIDLAGGSGMQHEVAAFVGKDKPDFSLAATADAPLRPVLSREAAAPVVEMYPFRIPGAGLWAEQVKRLWSASAAWDQKQTVIASASFSAAGMQLNVDNALGAALESPVIIWNGKNLSLGTIATGSSSQRVGPTDLNPVGDFSNARLIASENSRLRGRMLQASLSTGVEVPSIGDPQKTIILSAWLPDGTVEGLINPLGESPRMRSQTLVRTPVRVEPSSVGTRVKIDNPFMRLVPASTGILPYDGARQQWVPSTQGMDWLTGFAALPQIGRLRPIRATLTMDLSAPEQQVTIRRGQCAAGGEPGRPAGPVLGEWSNVIGQRTISFDCTPDDFDEQGRLWLAFSVQKQSLDATSTWTIRDLKFSLDEAEVIAP